VFHDAPINRRDLLVGAGLAAGMITMPPNFMGRIHFRTGCKALLSNEQALVAVTSARFSAAGGFPDGEPIQSSRTTFATRARTDPATNCEVLWAAEALALP
jgi:hypothetical protein